jgi:hypothetical protein
MMSSMPPSLLQLIDAGMRYDHDFELAGIDSRWKPPAVRAETLAAIISNHIPALRRYLAPATPKQISARIIAMLAHFWVGAMPTSLQTAIAADWVDALAAYPLWAIRESASSWLRSHTRKPTIADIVELCESMTRRDRLRLQLLERLVDEQGFDPASSHPGDERVSP